MTFNLFRQQLGKCAVIDGLRHRQSLIFSDLTSKIVTNPVIHLVNMGDIHPFANGPIFHCQTLILGRSDKNFAYYWLNPQTFPNLKQIVVDTHCGYELRNFSRSIQIYLPDYHIHHSGLEYIKDAYEVIEPNVLRELDKYIKSNTEPLTTLSISVV